MSEDAKTHLERAKSELWSSDDTSQIEPALASISEASADLELRSILQSSLLFERLLELYRIVLTSNKPPPRTLFRSIGNLVSDNDTNRSALVNDLKCIENLRLLLLSSTSEQSGEELQDFALKIFFNLCNDASDDIQKKAFEQNVHVAVIHYLYKRHWSDGDEALLGISVSLLASVLEQKNSIRPSEKHTSESVNQILKLPFLASLDTDVMLDVFTIICFYLQDKNFVLEIVETKQIDIVWQLVVYTEGIMQQGVAEDTELDEDDQKQYQHFLNAFAQCLADVSSLPAFNDKYAVEDAFVQTLGQQCLPPIDAGPINSLIPGCACLLLGNLAINDEASIALAQSVVPVNDLLQAMGKSNNGVFLNAAAGLLRHLAIPLTNRETLFGQGNYLRNVAHLYAEDSLEQVQIAGLQLTRQVITGMPQRAQGLIDGGGENGAPTVDTIIDLFTRTSSAVTKLEVARLIATLLRSLQSPNHSGALDEALDRLVNTTAILSPLIFAIKQAPAAGVFHAQADAWLALNLFVRIPGGAAVLAKETSADGELFSLLRQRLSKVGDAVVEAAHTSNSEAGQERDTKPEWIKEKERDNAVLLVHDLLQAEGVKDEVKEGLAVMLEESGVRVRI